ncbi:MAG TPA: glycoside hydrolase domain-containing protein [Sporichthyaceae bacterium]|jgi:hypothetical protein|nr:glycoside hydrolase domain-containing protein [Sporichthyaceae bacterium]
MAVTAPMPGAAGTTPDEAARGLAYAAATRTAAGGAQPGTKLPGTIQDAPNDVYGFDTADKLTGEDIAAIIRWNAAEESANERFAFAVRYISRHSPEPSNDLTYEEAYEILNAGLAFMVVQHVESVDSGEPTVQKGGDWGRGAVANARQIGYLEPGSIFLDLEAVATGTKSEVVKEYVNGWAEAVSEGCYSPGLYVGSKSGLNGAGLAEFGKPDPHKHRRQVMRNYWHSGGYGAGVVPELSQYGESYQMYQSKETTIYYQTKRGESKKVRFDHDVTKNQAPHTTLRWQKWVVEQA